MLINTNNFSDISNFINSLSYVDFEKIVKEYSIVNNINYDMTLNKMITVNLEERLNKLEINKTCPNCNSHLKVKNGKRPNGIQEYKCLVAVNYPSILGKYNFEPFKDLLRSFIYFRKGNHLHQEVLE